MLLLTLRETYALNRLSSFKNLRRKGGKFDHRPGRPKVLLRHCFFHSRRCGFFYSKLLRRHVVRYVRQFVCVLLTGVQLVAYYHNRVDGLLCKLTEPCVRRNFRPKNRSKSLCSTNKKYELMLVSRATASV